MPIVVDQAVPSEVQSTVGSEWEASPVVKASVVCDQVAPPSVENICTWWPLPTMLFEAAITFEGVWKLIAIEDSLRGLVAEPDVLMFGPPVVSRVSDWSGSANAAWRSWWERIHSWTSFRTKG